MLRRRALKLGNLINLGCCSTLTEPVVTAAQPYCSTVLRQSNSRLGSTAVLPWSLNYGIAFRGICSSSAPSDQAARQGNQSSRGASERSAEGTTDALQHKRAPFEALTDRIPERPVGVVEGTSYSIIIVAAFGLLMFLIYHFVTYLILEPLQYQCFNHTLEKLKTDPRITVRLGEDIRSWGRDSSNRAARQQIPHEVYKSHDGVEHVRLQFHMGGPGGVALVNADMYKDAQQKWQYNYLVADIMSQGAQQPQRVVIIAPK